MKWLALVVIAGGAVGVVVSLGPQRYQPPAPRRPPSTHFFVLLGIGDPQPTRWDGSVRVTGGKISKIDVWRPGPGDIADIAGWKVSSRLLTVRGEAVGEKDRKSVV